VPLLTDAAFDALLPAELAARSRQHFTPAPDALAVGAWLDELGVGSLCDLGAGVGKLCIVAALAAPRCRFVALERRASLVAVGRAIAGRLGVADRVAFVEGDVGGAPIEPFEAYYLYNPFGENLLPTDERIDEAVDWSDARWERDVAATEALLARAPRGTWLVTHDGFGGAVPADYALVREAPCARGSLALRRKA
jgi:predicted RNA methylase